MMKTPIIWIAFACTAGACLAGIGPSFSLEEVAWNSTDIIVGTQQEQGVVVLETWKGMLAKGRTIQVQGLPKVPLEVANWENPTVRKKVGGQRIVLFLKPFSGASASPETGGWMGVSRYGGTQVSAVWIDSGQPYAFKQMMNPGPTQLWPLKEDEAQFKQETLDILAAKEAMAKALLIRDPAQRLKALSPMAKGKYWFQWHEAIAAMGECGPVALPILHQRLEEYGRDTSEVASALARAAGDQAGAEMAAVLKQEVAFWNSEAPGLPVGWWISLKPEEKRQYFQHRYSILGPAIRAVVEQHYSPGRNVVLQLRDLWTSLPQLDDKSGLDQITEQCNEALRELPTPAVSSEPGS